MRTLASAGLALPPPNRRGAIPITAHDQRAADPLPRIRRGGICRSCTAAPAICPRARHPHARRTRRPASAPATPAAMPSPAAASRRPQGGGGGGS